jgi:hypothetical protein
MLSLSPRKNANVNSNYFLYITSHQPKHQTLPIHGTQISQQHEAIPDTSLAAPCGHRKSPPMPGVTSGLNNGRSTVILRYHDMFPLKLDEKSAIRCSRPQSLPQPHLAPIESRWPASILCLSTVLTRPRRYMMHLLALHSGSIKYERWPREGIFGVEGIVKSMKSEMDNHSGIESFDESFVSIV